MSEEQHRAILKYNGADATFLKMAEECSELSAAINKMFVAERNDDPTAHGKAYNRAIVEFADVLEAAARLKLIVDMDRVNRARTAKRNRTLGKIYESRQSQDKHE